ncbi:MAG: hypothetical protein HKP35_03550, partial [Silicimonas sp.]|nr:hypothetical protein [Silicimonas sp.]
MMPQRELAVGRAHRLLIPGWRLEDEDDATACLVPARDVAGINDNAYVGKQDTDITYFSIVFDEPQVFCANGLPVESFSPTDEAMRAVPNDVRDSLREAFPDLSPKFADYPAPRYKMREQVSYTPDFA